MGRNRPKTKRSQPGRQPLRSASNPVLVLDNRPANKLAHPPAYSPERLEMSGNEKETKNSSLTIRQQSALHIIAASPTVAQAARTSGIGESTLRRWLADNRFRQEVTRNRQESANLARQELQGLMLRSVSVLTEAMDDPDRALRVRAARYALSFAVQISEADRLTKQIRDFEEALPFVTGGKSLK